MVLQYGMTEPRNEFNDPRDPMRKGVETSRKTLDLGVGQSCRRFAMINARELFAICWLTVSLSAEEVEANHGPPGHARVGEQGLQRKTRGPKCRR
jgi:hypothetical protein